MENNFHKGVYVIIFVSWLYFKGIHSRQAGIEILPPFKNYFNKNDDK